MRKFKFIRGIYTDENIFNSDETNECWFACDKTGEEVSFTAQNNEKFQKRFVDLSSERLSELYTIRPSQFTIGATKQNNGDYSFHYKLNDDVYGGPESFLGNVKSAIESHLSKNIKVNTSFVSSLILPNSSGDPTLVNFTYKGEKTLARGLYFKVSGELTKYTLDTADGKEDIAYIISDNGEIDFSNKFENRMFSSGKLQELVQPMPRTVAIGTEIVGNTNYNSLKVESIYQSASGFMFVCNSALTDKVNYSEISNSVLYRYVNEYLTSVTSSVALDGGRLGSSYVAYKDGQCPSGCYRKNGSETESVYEFSLDGCVQSSDTSVTDWEGYSFYEKHIDGAYVIVGPCSAKDIGDIIVKGYEESYSGHYVISGNVLEPLDTSDLLSTSINVYSELNDYNIISDGVYTNDVNDFNYVTLSNEATEDITKDNVKIDPKTNTVAPKQENNVFRQIKNVYINATESLD